MNFINRNFKNNKIIENVITMSVSILLIFSTMLFLSFLIPISQSEILVITPDICVEKLVDFDGDGVFHEFEVGSYDGTATWKINVTNCCDDLLSRIFVNDTNGMSWGPFDLIASGFWEVSYDEMHIVLDKCNNVSVEGVDVSGAYVGPVFDEACV